MAVRNLLCPSHHRRQVWVLALQLQIQVADNAYPVVEQIICNVDWPKHREITSWLWPGPAFSVVSPVHTSYQKLCSLHRYGTFGTYCFDFIVLILIAKTPMCKSQLLLASCNPYSVFRVKFSRLQLWVKSRDSCLFSGLFHLKWHSPFISMQSQIWQDSMITWLDDISLCKYMYFVYLSSDSWCFIEFHILVFVK